MTITIAWVRRSRDTSELVIAADSRLRSYGAMDQSQKIFPLQRGDCALAFCGDATVAYPFFVQAASALNGFIRTRTRADDIHATSVALGRVLNNLVASWDASDIEKQDQLRHTRVLFSGWSWRLNKFQIGFFKYIQGAFRYLQATENLPKPWCERQPSLIVLGDYRPDFMKTLGEILTSVHGSTAKWSKTEIDLDYEPLEALNDLLHQKTTLELRPFIGGAPQAVKLYSHSNVLPLVVRTSPNDHFLFGRKLFEWEKTEYPIADVSGGRTTFLYPMSAIPRPAEIGLARQEATGTTTIRNLIRFFVSRGAPTPPD